MEGINRIVKDNHKGLFDQIEENDKTIQKINKTTPIVVFPGIFLSMWCGMFLQEIWGVLGALTGISLMIIFGGIAIHSTNKWRRFNDQSAVSSIQIKFAVEEKFKKDLKKFHHASFVGNGSPYESENNNYVIKTEDNETFNAHITYDNNNKMKVSLLSKIVEIDENDKEAFSNIEEVENDFNVIESLKSFNG